MSKNICRKFWMDTSFLYNFVAQKSILNLKAILNRKLILKFQNKICVLDFFV